MALYGKLWIDQIIVQSRSKRYSMHSATPQMHKGPSVRLCFYKNFDAIQTLLNCLIYIVLAMTRTYTSCSNTWVGGEMRYIALFLA